MEREKSARGAGNETEVSGAGLTRKSLKLERCEGTIRSRAASQHLRHPNPSTRLSSRRLQESRCPLLSCLFLAPFFKVAVHLGYLLCKRAQAIQLPRTCTFNPNSFKINKSVPLEKKTSLQPCGNYHRAHRPPENYQFPTRGSGILFIGQGRGWVVLHCSRVPSLALRGPRCKMRRNVIARLRKGGRRVKADAWKESGLGRFLGSERAPEGGVGEQSKSGCGAAVMFRDCLLEYGEGVMRYGGELMGFR